MSKRTEFLAKAAEIDRAHQAAVKALQARDDLSAVGKQQEYERLEGNRRRAVAALQDEARLQLEVERNAAQKKLKEARGKDEAAMRELLGPAAMVELVKARLSVLSPSAISRWHDETTDAWTKAVVGEFADVELTRRLDASNAQDTAASIAYQEIRRRAPALSPEVTALQATVDELRDVDAVVKSLDGGARRRELASVYGVSEKNYDPFSSVPA